MGLALGQGAMEGHRHHVSQHSDPWGNTDLLGFTAGLISSDGDQQGGSPAP